MLNPVTLPRKYLTRVLLAGLLDIAVWGSAGSLSLAVQDTTGSHALAGLAVWLFSAPFTVWFAPRVSYRRRDALLGPWMVAVIAWRIAYLPYRDWPPRDDEVPQAQYIRKAQFAAEWRPEYAGLWTLPQSSDTHMANSSAPKA